MAIPYGIQYWHNQISRNGIRGDVLNSMLQKSIRRGEETSALAAAYEMYITSNNYLDMLWFRLQCIAIEDIGFGQPEAGRLIRTLNEMRKEFAYEDGDQALFFVHAIRYLCRCTKERSSDEMKCILADRAKEGFPYDVPDYTYDMHTVKGREMGRGTVHFLQEASKVEPELQAKWVQVLHDAYLNVARLEQESPGEAVVQAYLDTQWDYKE